MNLKNTFIGKLLCYPRKTVKSLFKKQRSEDILKSRPLVQPLPGFETPIFSEKVNLGPLKFIPHDGGLGSNINFLVGEIYVGRQLYPLFTKKEFKTYNNENKHFCYFRYDEDNAWMDFFEPIKYFENDNMHIRKKLVSKLPHSFCGPYAPPEFRFPNVTKKLYKREDFGHWRNAVSQCIRNKLKLKTNIREEIDNLLHNRDGEILGVHMRHPSHMCEQGEVLFESYFQKIDDFITRYPKCSIFLATDNDLSIAVLKQRYGNKIFYFDTIRASVDSVLRWAYSCTKAQQDEFGFTNGVGFQIHYSIASKKEYDKGEGIQAGKDAVRDVFALARCKELICTISNFSLICSYQNPQQKLNFVEIQNEDN